mmetsp:Transcript_44344/g.141014  ORF Transcript_44344/g.141014 Transcript_44344/m.141014 type:complete len:172 (+) Transcript_44344:332-847(+)
MSSSTPSSTGVSHRCLTLLPATLAALWGWLISGRPPRVCEVEPTLERVAQRWPDWIRPRARLCAARPGLRAVAAAEERILNEYKSVDRVAGQSRSTGVNMAGAAEQEFKEKHLLAGSSTELSHAECQTISTLDYPIYSDEDIMNFADIEDRLPFSVEQKMKITLCPIVDED